MTVRPPVVVNAFRSSVLLSLIVTAVMVPDKGVNVTALEKVLAWFRLILYPLSTLKVEAPVIAIAPVLVIPPPAVAVTV